MKTASTYSANYCYNRLARYSYIVWLYIKFKYSIIILYYMNPKTLTNVIYNILCDAIAVIILLKCMLGTSLMAPWAQYAMQ